MRDEIEPPEATFDHIAIELLDLDKSNPRFADGSLDLTDENPQLGFLARHSNLADLMKSIGAQGFFPGEPIMVVPKGDEPKDGYVVVEGNRRTAASILLANPQFAPDDSRRSISLISESARFKPSVIPALIFAREQDIHRYLGYRHISGVQEWSPLAKAMYVRRQYEELEQDGKTVDQRLQMVGERIGSTGTYAARLMTSLAIYELARDRAFFRLDIQPAAVSFSLITVAITRRPINQYLRLQSSKDFTLRGLDEEALQNLFDWLFVRTNRKTVLGDSRNVSKLADVLAESSGAALKTLIATRDLEVAWESTVSDSDDVAEALEDCVEALQEVLLLVESGDRELTSHQLGLLAQLGSIVQAISRAAIDAPGASSG